MSATSLPQGQLTGRPASAEAEPLDVCHRPGDPWRLQQPTALALDSISEGFVILDRRWRFTFANSAAEQFALRSRTELLGNSLWELFPEASRRRFGLEYRRAMTENVPVHFEEFYPEPLNKWYEVRAYPSAEGLSIFFRDVTERRRIEDALRERIKELDCLYAIADLTAHEDHLEGILQGTVELMPRGWLHSEVACARIILDEHEFKTANFRATTERLAADIILHGKPVGRVEVGYLEERPIRDEGPFLKEERSLINAIAERLGRVVERVRIAGELERARTELQRVNDQLQAANDALRRTNETLEARVAARTADLAKRTAQLQALARDLAHAEEQERQRVGEVIHDELQQLLSVARINLGIALEQVRARSIQKGLSGVDRLIGESLDITHALASELNPAILRRSGLAATLRWLGRSYEDRFGLKVLVEAEKDADVDAETRATLFRFVRELLFNVVKHAHVGNARVGLSRAADGRVRIVVSDHGVGFDPEILRAAEGTGSFGLFNLRERLELLGGALDVNSAPGCGTSVTILVGPALAARHEAPAPAATPRAGAVRKRTNARRTTAQERKR